VRRSSTPIQEHDSVCLVDVSYDSSNKKARFILRLQRFSFKADYCGESELAAQRNFHMLLYHYTITTGWHTQAALYP
jgi:hypothetical protein